MRRALPFRHYWNGGQRYRNYRRIALGGLLIACSKERIEDEMTRSLRLAALLNSIYMNTILLICCTISFNGVEFLKYAVANLMLLPVLFVFTFRAEIYRYHKMCENEEQD